MSSNQAPVQAPSIRALANLSPHDAQQPAAVPVKRRTHNNHASMMGTYFRKNELAHDEAHFDHANFSNAADPITPEHLPYRPRNAPSRSDSMTFIDAGQLPMVNGNVPANLVHHVPVQYMSHWDRVKNSLRRVMWLRL
jgi:hypothetical protein